MSTRVSPIEGIRAGIDDLFGSERELGEVLEEVARLGVRLLMRPRSRPKSPSFWAVSATATANGSARAAATGTVRPRSSPRPGQ